MLSIFRRLMKSEQGATAIEYTLIASLIAVAAIAAMNTVGGKIQDVLSNVANAMIIAPTFGQRHGRPGNGPPISFAAVVRLSAHDLPATFLTKVTRLHGCAGRPSR